MTAKHHPNDPRILILDFGSQYAELIARRVRECGVYCELISADATAAEIQNFKPNGIILSGGPETVNADNTPRAPKVVFEMGCPVLGICYGMQTMATQLGGAVELSSKHEFGHALCDIDKATPLFQALDKDTLDVWMSHGDHVTKLPNGFITIAKTSNAPIAAIAHAQKQFYGVQFHPEVTHTPQGKQLLHHFVKSICGCESTWTAEHIIEESIADIRTTVGDQKVLLGLSGGVDSSVLAALLQRAIGDQLMCVFVDTGLLRLHEGDEVMQIFSKQKGINVIRVNAKDLFFEKLKNVVDPEEKRKIIGHLFIEIFEKEAEKISHIAFLAQGTIYPDVIESAKTGSKNAHTIKSHHNVGGLPDDMPFELLEPLRELFKDEVREIGLKLGLPAHMINRHPFPGPGLAVRILEEVKKEYVEILQQADNIFIQALRQDNLYDTVSQAFAVFLPVQSVGVKGDRRCYDYVIALRAVTTTDFMTAEWARLPHDFLAKVSNQILNEVSRVTRVVYDISGKPPATIEWE